MECEEKYRTIKSLSRTLQENPWDKHLRIKVYKLKKDFNKLTRKKHRLYRNILINGLCKPEDRPRSLYYCNLTETGQ
jgi:hypothetical protein